MAEEKVYANLNPFPVTLPSPRGGQRTVAPNEIVKGEWWGRMVGSRRLSEVDPTRYNIVGRRINQGVNIQRPGKANGQPVSERRHVVEQIPVQTNTKSGRIGEDHKAPKKLSKVETLCDGCCESGCEASCEAACELNAQSIQEEDHYRIIGEL